MKRIATIGVYGFTAETFLEKLTGGGVGLLLDLRQRRGVRGPDYSWANSVRLQRALAAAGIDYRHVTGLAPTTALRQLQYREDDRQGVGKRNRNALAPELGSDILNARSQESGQRPYEVPGTSRRNGVIGLAPTSNPPAEATTK